MSLLGVLDSAVSGMTAQSQKLTNVGTNISNSDTVGYKEASTQFETLLGGADPGGAVGGGTITRTRNIITAQGTMATTGSATDLAVKGSGFLSFRIQLEQMFSPVQAHSYRILRAIW